MYAARARAGATGRLEECGAAAASAVGRQPLLRKPPGKATASSEMPAERVLDTVPAAELAALAAGKRERKAARAKRRAAKAERAERRAAKITRRLAVA